MNAYVKTPIAARQLELSYTKLINQVRYGKIKAPVKDSSGDYMWSAADMAAARNAVQGAAAVTLAKSLSE